MDLMTYMLAQKGGGGGGSDLPVVTPADDGKILGVVSGAWNTVNPDTVIDLPMTLRVGTQESPVYLSELDEGLYAINGKYYILRNSESFETDYNIIALVSKEEGLDRAKVKVITADDVIDYDIKENGSSIAVYTNKIVTEKYLSDNHYVIETDLAGYVPKISNPEGDKIVVSDLNGEVSESEIAIDDIAYWDTSGTTGYILVETAEGGIKSASVYPDDIVTGNIDSEGDEIDYLITSDHTSSGNDVAKSSIATTNLITGYDANGFDSDEHLGEIIIAYGDPGDYNKVGVSGVKVEDLVTGGGSEGYLAVWNDSNVLGNDDISVAAVNSVIGATDGFDNERTIADFIGSIPQDSSATTIIDYIDEITTPIQSIPNTPCDIATFNASALPMPSLTVGIEATQSGSGDPSPTNIRPISGWSAVNVNDVGDNWGDCADIPKPLTANLWQRVNLPNNTYTISFDVVNAVRTALGDTVVFVPYDGTTNTNILTSKIYSVEDGSTYQSKGANISGRFYFTYTGKLQSIGCYWRSNSYQLLTSGSLENIMIEVGANPTKQFKPYNGTTYTIDLDGTRYGGQLDVVSGVLTVDRAFLSNDYLVNTASYESASRGCFALIGITLKSMGSDVVDTKLMASALKTSSQNDLYTNKNVGIAHWWNTRIGFSTGDETITTVSAFKQWLTDNGSDVVCEPATPITIQLTPTMVKSLLGTNNLWADSGKVLSGEYRSARYQDIYTYGALPSVMSSDNGKILQVVNGEWQAVDLDANSTSY